MCESESVCMSVGVCESVCECVCMSVGVCVCVCDKFPQTRLANSDL